MDDVRDVDWFDTLLDHTRDILAVVDEAGSVTYASPAVEDITGITPETVVGENILDFVHPADRDRLRAHLSTLVDTEATTIDRFSHRFRTSDDRWLWVETGGKDATDTPLDGYVLNSRDLSERRELFKSVTEASPDLIYFKDSDHRLIHVGQTYADILDADSEELIGKTTGELWPEELAERILADERRALNGEKITDREREVVHDGSVHWYSVNKIPRYDDDGNVIGFFAIDREITEQKRRVKELQRFRQAVEGATDMLAAADRKYRYLFANERYREFHGIAEDTDPSALTIEDVIGEERFEEVKPHLDRVHDGETIAFEMTRRNRSGEKRVLDIQYYPLRDDDGSVIGDVASIRDVTERKNREIELREHKERLDLALEGANLGVWDWDMRTDEVSRDQNWLAMLGYTAEEIEDRLGGWERLTHPDDTDNHADALEPHIAGENDYYQCDYRLRTKAGNWKWVRNIGKIVEWDEDGDPVRAVGIHQDIDEQKRTRQRLEQNTELLTVIDRVLRHNLQNDMNVIEGFARTIRDESSGEIADHADRIVETSVALMGSVNKERAITKFLADPTPAETFDVVPAIEASVSHLATQHPDAEITTDLPKSCVVTARRELGQAIEELVENAIIHSDKETPKVTVELDHEDDIVEVRIANNGPRIPEMERKVLTEQAEITPLYHGSGMGLWLVNLIVRQSEGELDFTPREPRGSIVSMRLPDG